MFKFIPNKPNIKIQLVTFQQNRLKKALPTQFVAAKSTEYISNLKI